MKVILWMTVTLLAGTLAARAGDTGTDPAQKYAWGENVGWLNAHSDHRTVTIHYSEGTGGWFSGHLWAENIVRAAGTDLRLKNNPIPAVGTPKPDTSPKSYHTLSIGQAKKNINASMHPGGTRGVCVRQRL